MQHSSKVELYLGGNHSSDSKLAPQASRSREFDLPNFPAKDLGPEFNLMSQSHYFI